MEELLELVRFGPLSVCANEELMSTNAGTSPTLRSEASF